MSDTMLCATPFSTLLLRLHLLPSERCVISFLATTEDQLMCSSATGLVDQMPP